MRNGALQPLLVALVGVASGGDSSVGEERLRATTPPDGYIRHRSQGPGGVGDQLSAAGVGCNASQSGPAQCLAVAAAACNSTPGCGGFSYIPSAAEDVRAYLFAGAASSAVRPAQCGNPDWTYFCRPGRCGAPCPPLPPPPPPPRWEGQVKRHERQLFIDELGVAAMDNLRLTMHRPKKKGAVIRPFGFALQDAAMINCQVRSAPIWLEDERRFRFLVAGCNGTNTIYDKHGSHTRSQWYTSTDGVQWVHEDNAGSNGLAVGVDGVYMVVYLPRQPFLFMLSPWIHRLIARRRYDPNDKPSARYKSMIPDQFGAHGGGALISPNGLNWTVVPAGLGIETSDEQ